MWDGPSTNGYGIAIPASFGSWAYWNVRPPTGHQINTFYHYWFCTEITIVAPLAQDVKLINKADSSMLSVNDDIYVYVNGSLAACGGTAAQVGYSVPAGFVNSINDKSRSIATDGWLINGGLTIPKTAFATGPNQICILTEDFWDWGGLAQPVFQLTYDDYTLGGVTPTPAFNSVATQHTVNVQVTPAVAGVAVTFVVEGDNAQTGTATTNGSGIASFQHTGSSAGVDSIWAYIDLNGNGSWDAGEPKSDNTATKYWLENFVTGGGTYKSGRTTFWTFAGTVGVLEDVGIVGQFQIVDHTNKVAWHCNNNFSSLVFSGEPIVGPPGPSASHSIATFTGTFTNNRDATTKVITVTIKDLGEPGAGVDMITLSSGLSLGEIAISGGNFQVHNVED